MKHYFAKRLQSTKVFFLLTLIFNPYFTCKIRDHKVFEQTDPLAVYLFIVFDCELRSSKQCLIVQSIETAS